MAGTVVCNLSLIVLPSKNFCSLVDLEQDSSVNKLRGVTLSLSCGQSEQFYLTVRDNIEGTFEIDSKKLTLHLPLAKVL